MEIIEQFELSETLDDKTLRQRLKAQGVEARRLSRFTQLALFGALALKDHITPESRIYLGSSFNSPSKFHKMFDSLMNDGVPSPLDFMANINNAATFHITQTLNTQGGSVFLALEKSELEQLFQLAELDLQINQTALIGWVKEDSESIEFDESCWWLVRA